MSTFPLKNNCFVTSVTLLSLCKLGPDSMNMEPETLRDAF